MKKTFFLLSLLALVNFECLSLDSFIFSSSRLSSYTLDGNILPQNFEEFVHFTSGDQNDTLYGYFVKSGSLKRNKNYTLMYFHGNLNNINEYWERFQHLHRIGFNLFIFDYKGYGMSQGENKDETDLIEDANAAINYITQTRNIEPDSILLYGFSLGAVPVTYLATKQEFKDKFIAVILEAPFASASSITQNSSVLPIPNGWLNHTNFDNVTNVKSLSIPTMVLHGAQDSTTRYRDNGKVVFENIAASNKKLILVENSGHSEIINQLSIDTYLDTITTWLNDGVLPD